jgi:hypothetical protein
MNLLVVYIVCVVIGQSITIGIGLAIDRLYSPHASLIVSISMYFLVFWVAWRVAVRLTEPKAESSVLPPR